MSDANDVEYTRLAYTAIEKAKELQKSLTEILDYRLYHGYIDSIEGTKTKGPRGDSFYFCYLYSDGTVAFGNVAGNYAFGIDFTPPWYYERRGYNSSGRYDSSLDEWLEYYKQKDKPYYNRIIELLTVNGAKHG